MTHNKKCLARAILAAVENIRDYEYMTDIDFRLSMQENEPLSYADQYLQDGTIDCVCQENDPAYRIKWIVENYDAAITKALASGDLTIPPSWAAVPMTRVRVARLARAIYKQELSDTLDTFFAHPELDPSTR